MYRDVLVSEFLEEVPVLNVAPLQVLRAVSHFSTGNPSLPPQSSQFLVRIIEGPHRALHVSSRMSHPAGINRFSPPPLLADSSIGPAPSLLADPLIDSEPPPLRARWRTRTDPAAPRCLSANQIKLIC